MSIDSASNRFLRILVIDDNQAIHGDFDKILLRNNQSSPLDDLDAELFGRKDKPQPSVAFDLAHATQGKDGLEILERSMQEGKPFGVAFVDMRMPPGWDGVETIQRLWAADPNLQVVICTAYSDHSWQRIVEKLGYNDRLLVLKKPFDEIEVVQLATSLCEKRRLLEVSRSKMNSLEQEVSSQAIELQEAHENAETLIQSITSVLICIDEHGKVSRWNPIAEQLFSINKSQAIGHPYIDLPIDWHDKQLAANLTNERSSDGPCRSELMFTDRQGTTTTLEVNVFPIVGAPQSQTRLIIANDITLQKKLQSQLEQAQKLESVGQLAAGVAHEINTPMQYIGDNIRYVSRTIDRFDSLLKYLPDLLDETISDEEIVLRRKTLSCDIPADKMGSWLSQLSEALSDSIQGVDTVAKIVSAMKELSHPGTQEKSRIDLNRILHSAITVAKSEWKHIADVRIDACSDMPPLMGFPSELNQAILNIIVNAVHAIRDRIATQGIERGQIYIKTSFNEDFAIISIADNGGGVPVEIRDKVFEPFFTTKEIGKGTGQGLAIAHSAVVSKHGGTLSLEVREGQGSKFTLQIPFEKEKATELNTATAQTGIYQ
ncbi:PAS domain-containing protein [Stieleria sp. JC731]|nr:ATP-binding protein [Stieleria sp. JC731]MCC9601699.1 PAS domain-containing protein [Stieleria sp. JC731]